MQEINLYDLMRFYAKNWLTLLGALFLGALIGLTYTNVIQTPLYRSDATLIVVEPASTADKPISAYINNNYAELFKSRLVLENVIEDEKYTGSYDQLLMRTTASADSNTDFLRISMADTTPEGSQALLNAAITSFKKEATTIYASAENIKTVDAASLPETAYNVRAGMQTAIAVAATFFVAVITLFFVYDYKNSKAARVKTTNTAKKRTTTPKKGNKA